LVSFGQVSNKLLSWKSHAATVSSKEKSFLLKYKLTEADWLKVKKNVVFELVNEDVLLTEIYELLKEFKQIDPAPAFENLLYWLSYAAEKQQPITYQGGRKLNKSLYIFLNGLQLPIDMVFILNRYTRLIFFYLH
jgi:hypothetical protein